MNRRLLSPLRISALAAAVLALGACADAPRVVVLARHPSVAQLQVARGVAPGYVYYPDYELYYSRAYQQYVFRFNHGWMRQPRPPISAEELISARQVPVNFTDDPSHHHAEIARLYPRNEPRRRPDLALNR